MSANCVDVIAHNLYLGDKNAATDLELISKLELTHILSVDMVPLPQVVSSTFPNLAMHQISVADMVDEDLLSHFESAIRFIKEGVTRGAILVHCYHGVSIWHLKRDYDAFWVEGSVKQNFCFIMKICLVILNQLFDLSKELTDGPSLFIVIMMG